MKDQNFHVLKLHTSTASATILEEWLAPFPCPHANTEKDGLSVIEFYTTSVRDRDAIRHLLEKDVPAWTSLLPDPVEISECLLAQEDWEESWKQYFHPLRASARIVIKPSWEELPANLKGIPHIIEIDPGMSFGTGRHGTTLACLQFIDQLAARIPDKKSMVDIGCGSGILEVAAAMLGYDPIIGIDIDPCAVRCAHENLTINGIGGVDCVVADISTFHSSQTYTTVVANMETSILLPNAESITGLATTESKAFLILSGILVAEFDPAVRLFSEFGFSLLDTIIIDEWQSGLMSRAATHPAFPGTVQSGKCRHI